MKFPGPTVPSCQEHEEFSLNFDGVEILTKACVVLDQRCPKSLVDWDRTTWFHKDGSFTWDKPGTIGLTVDSTVLVPFASADGSADA